MESERKMKLTKLAKNLLAVSALTVASFGANAGAIATSEFTISGFGIYQGDGAGNIISATPLSGITISESDFFGSTAGTGNSQLSMDDIFTDPNETEFDTNNLGYENFSFGVTDGLNSANLQFTGANGSTAPTGSTYAHAEVAGTSTAEASTRLENSARFTYSDGDDNTSAGTTTNALFAYSYLLSLIADSTVSWETGTAEAYGDFQVMLFGGGAPQTVFDFNFSNQNLPNIADSGSKTAAAILMEGINYTITVVQTSSVDVRSVAEPTTIAMLGLGLLGFAGVSRRRKS